MLVAPGCSMDDDDDDTSLSDPDAFKEVLAANCIELVGNSDPSSGLDSLSNDTLKIFPTDEVFHKLLMQSLLSSQGMVKLITRSIDASVFGRDGSSWMNYYEPYLGVYSSADDSRSKQWNLEEKCIYDGTQWDYHLCIHDLPEGVASDNSGERAVEVFYNSDFSRGIMIFSPTSFDAVRFPTKIFGPDIKGIFTFANNDGNITNTLYLTNIGVNNNVKYIRNVYLQTELSNGCIAIQTMIDFPALWFDNKENSGFTVSSIGACDVSTGGAVLYAGIVRNNSNEKTATSLVVGHPYDKVLAQYYPLWQKMVEDNNVIIPDPKDSENPNEAENNTSNFDEDLVEEETTSKDSPADSEDLYGKPGYYINGVYMPSSTITDKSPYLKALNKSLDMMDSDFPISPYKNSVNQIEWSSEKSR
ncbi:MAG: hypothetical protein K6F33_02865 [Bacteroidales bacterium]|nr:hypothetical protein [Bacteroidales bacterium]